MQLCRLLDEVRSALTYAHSNLTSSGSKVAREEIDAFWKPKVARMMSFLEMAATTVTAMESQLQGQQTIATLKLPAARVSELKKQHSGSEAILQGNQAASGASTLGLARRSSDELSELYGVDNANASALTAAAANAAHQEHLRSLARMLRAQARSEQNKMDQAAQVQEELRATQAALMSGVMREAQEACAWGQKPSDAQDQTAANLESWRLEKLMMALDAKAWEHIAQFEAQKAALEASLEESEHKRMAAEARCAELSHAQQLAAQPGQAQQAAAGPANGWDVLVSDVEQGPMLQEARLSQLQQQLKQLAGERDVLRQELSSQKAQSESEREEKAALEVVNKGLFKQLVKIAKQVNKATAHDPRQSAAKLQELHDQINVLEEERSHLLTIIGEERNLDDALQAESLQVKQLKLMISLIQGHNQELAMALSQASSEVGDWESEKAALLITKAELLRQCEHVEQERNELAATAVELDSNDGLDASPVAWKALQQRQTALSQEITLQRAASDLGCDLAALLAEKQALDLELDERAARATREPGWRSSTSSPASTRAHSPSPSELQPSLAIQMARDLTSQLSHAESIVPKERAPICIATAPSLRPIKTMSQVVQLASELQEPASPRIGAWGEGSGRGPSRSANPDLQVKPKKRSLLSHVEDAVPESPRRAVPGRKQHLTPFSRDPPELASDPDASGG
ncbi:hypothetical protein WJX72_004202 [[Myrmecia] bisecta]|uniref:Uncharacterized protein n=1 Tax=[Myrmecia] bisecta TaxID=41462 RepID=A0AAW1PSP7_9CHLO